jgi:hypothetical protein
VKKNYENITDPHNQLTNSQRIPVLRTPIGCEVHPLPTNATCAHDITNQEKKSAISALRHILVTYEALLSDLQKIKHDI